jgi:predicted nucleic acid-binding protein
MLSGARSPRETKIIGELLNSIRIVPLDVSAADRAAGIRRGLERKGVGIGMADSLIAGIMLQVQVGGTLLARNLRHFQRVEGLDLARF